MKRIIAIIILLVTSVTLYSQTTDSRLKVGVVLGGGGAKGASHIGVLKYIEEMGIPVDYVAGTSMGSIIGGFYAMGYSPGELTRLIADMNWSEYIGNRIDRSNMAETMRLRNSTTQLVIPFSLESLFANDPNASFISQLPSAYVNNSSLINLFNDLSVGYQEDMDFNDLPIPFACVATDIVTGEEVVMRSGSVPNAMRASMAIPGLFSPVVIGNHVLVDGGLVNNFPADVLREMGADIIIGVEVTSTKDVTVEDLKSLPQVFARLVTNSTSSKRKTNRELCNVHIVPDISGFGMLSFSADAIDTLVNRGYRRADDFHDQLLEIKRAVDASAGHPVSKELHAPHAKDISKEAVFFKDISIDNVSDRQIPWLVRKGGLKPGSYYSKDDIEQAISVYRGTGSFDEITYHVVGDSAFQHGNQLADAYQLNIHVTPAKPHVFGLGVRYDTEDGAALLLGLGLNEKKFSGSKLSLSAKLSYNPNLNLTYTYARPALANFNLAADYRNENFTWMILNAERYNLHYRQYKFSAYISQFHLLNFSTAVGVSYSKTKFDNFSLDDSSFDSVYFAKNDFVTPYVTLRYDNLDHDYFPKHGVLARFTGRYHIDMNTKKRLLDLGYEVQVPITPYHGRLTIIPQLYGRYMDYVDYANMWSWYGGDMEGRHFEEQMPFVGFTGVSLSDQNSTVVRLDLRYNFYGNHYLTAMYNRLVSWSINGVDLDFVDGAGLKYSYNSSLGPISLTGYWNNSGGNNGFGAYFSLGYMF